MIFLFKIIITIAIVGAGTYLSEWLGSNWFSKWDKIWVVAITAIIATVALTLINALSDNFEKYLKKPTILIQTSKQANEINILIDIKRSIERISLNYPVLGQVTNFQDLNALTDARTVLAKVVGGATQNDAQNNLQITITDIKPNIRLQYKIFYNATQGNIVVAGTDRYEISYVWQYNGEKIQETEWRLTENDNLTKKSKITVIGAQIFDRVLTPEEIKKMYEDGPPQRNY